MDGPVQTLPDGQPVPARARRFDGLRLIALLKLGKALVLIATSYGVHMLLKAGLLGRLNAWSATLTDSVERRLLLRALSWIENLGAKRIQILVAITLAYTAVVLAEGIGLWFRRAWAEWLTVLATGSLIPFELWELIRRPPGHRAAVVLALTFNAAVVWYLVWLLRATAARNSITRA